MRSKMMSAGGVGNQVMKKGSAGVNLMPLVS